MMEQGEATARHSVFSILKTPPVFSSTPVIKHAKSEGGIKDKVVGTIGPAVKIQDTVSIRYLGKLDDGTNRVFARSDGELVGMSLNITSCYQSRITF